MASNTTDKIIALFPTQVAAFDSSLAALLLSRLSHYFWLLDYPSAQLRECHHSVELTRPALKMLSTLTFGTEAQSSTVDDNADEFDGLFVVKKTKQKDRKKAKRATRSISVDSKPFDQLGVNVPCSQQAAKHLEVDLLDNQKEILTVRYDDLFDRLRTHWTCSYILESCGSPNSWTHSRDCTSKT